MILKERNCFSIKYALLLHLNRNEKYIFEIFQSLLSQTRIYYSFARKPCSIYEGKAKQSNHKKRAVIVENAHPVALRDVTTSIEFPVASHIIQLLVMHELKNLQLY